MEKIKQRNARLESISFATLIFFTYFTNKKMKQSLRTEKIENACQEIIDTFDEERMTSSLFSNKNFFTEKYKQIKYICKKHDVKFETVKMIIQGLETINSSYARSDFNGEHIQEFSDQ